MTDKNSPMIPICENDEQFNAIMEQGCNEAINGESIPADQAFDKIKKEI